MTPAERRQQLRSILDQHNAAVRAYRDASFDAAIAGMRATLDAMERAQRAQDEAIAAVIAANTAALALFNAED
jgi:hypothetical protein